LCNTDYYIHYGKPVVVLSCRDQKGRRVRKEIYSFKPYFYVSEHLASVISEEFGRVKIEDVDFIGFPFYPIKKVIVEKPRDVRDIARYYAKDRRFKHVLTRHIFEADVLFSLRYLIDRGIYSGIDYDPYYETFVPKDAPTILRKQYLDIETYTERPEDMTSYNTPILVIGVYDSFDKEYTLFSLKDMDSEVLSKELYNIESVRVVKCLSERDLLQSFINYIRLKDPDVIFTFSLYDFTVIYNRCKKLHVRYRKLSPAKVVVFYEDKKELRIGCRSILDLQKLYRITYGSPRWETLDVLAQRYLGYGRKYHRESVFEMWKKEPDKVLIRNIIDVELTKELEEELKLLERFDTIRKIAGCNFNDTLYPSRVSDIMYLRLTHGKVALPTKSMFKKVRYKGAVVKDVVPGKYTRVLLLDWKSMYPNIIRAFNISYDTLRVDGDIVVTEDIRFKSSPKGWTSQILEQLIPVLEENKRKIKEATERKDWKKVELLKKARLGLKSIVNGVYGYYGFAGDYIEHIPAARLYHPLIAEAITYIGRTLMEEGVFPAVESLGYNILYGDTDSVFIQLKEGTEEEANILRDKLGKLLREFIYNKWKVRTEYLEMDIETMFESIVFKTKKRYVGITVDGEEIVKGLEIVRKDQADITYIVQKVMLKFILKDMEDKAVHFLKQIVRNFRKIPLKKLAVSMKVNRPFNTYKSYTEPLKAVDFSNTYLDAKILPGQRFYVVRVKKVPGYPSTLSRKFGSKERTVKVSTVAFKTLDTLPDNIEIDYEEMLLKTVRKKVEWILELINHSWEDVIEEQVSLDSFNKP